MVKHLDKPLRVNCTGRKIPRSFLFSGKWQAVSQILEIWKDTGTWWDGESEKTFYRLEAANGSLYEIYLDSAESNWFLYRIYD